MISENDPFIAGSNYSNYSTATIPTITNNQCVFNKSITFVTPELPKIPGMHEVPEIVSIKKDVENYTCEICSKKFPFPCRLREHRLTHTDEKPQEFYIYDDSLVVPSYLTTYNKLMHKPKITYKCGLCGKEYSGLTWFAKHIKCPHKIIYI